MNLCDEIQAAGLQPFTMGFKDTWTCLAPWNGLAVDLAPSDVCRQVNQGKTTFTENYREVAEKMLQLLSYGPKDPFAYKYSVCKRRGSHVSDRKLCGTSDSVSES